MSGLVYVVGSEGYIGSLLRTMIPENQLVRVGNPRKTYDDTDVVTSLPKQVARGSTCFLLAALAGETACEQNRALAYETNVQLVRTICDLNFEKIIFTSTSSLYGESDYYATEDSEVTVTSFYTETKLEAEDIILSSNKKNVVARLAIAIGLSTNTDWSQLVNNMVKCALEGSTIQIYGSRAFRPYYDVYDVAQGLLLLNNTIEYEGQIVNVGSTSLNLSKADLLRQLQHHIPYLNYSILSEFDKRNYKVSFDKFANVSKSALRLEDTFIKLINYYGAVRTV